MAEGDGSIYNEFKFRILNGSLNLANGGDAIRTMLVTGHALDIDNDTVYADVSGDEEAGAGYVAKGDLMANQATTKDNANDRADFDADNTTWAGLDVGTPNYAIMFDDDVADYLMAAWELTTASNGGDYTLQWHADGIILIT